MMNSIFAPTNGTLNSTVALHSSVEPLGAGDRSMSPEPDPGAPCVEMQTFPRTLPPAAGHQLSFCTTRQLPGKNLATSLGRPSRRRSCTTTMSTDPSSLVTSESNLPNPPNAFSRERQYSVAQNAE